MGALYKYCFQMYKIQVVEPVASRSKRTVDGEASRELSTTDSDLGIDNLIPGTKYIFRLASEANGVVSDYVEIEVVMSMDELYFYNKRGFIKHFEQILVQWKLQL